MRHSQNSPHLQAARIVVADDHALLREGIVGLIERHSDEMTVCAEADNIRAVTGAVEEWRPDLLLLDLRLGNGDSLQLIKTLRATHPATRILVISQHDERLFAERCVRAGAYGFLSKSEASTELIVAMRCVLRGEIYLSRRLAVTIFQEHIPKKPTITQGDELSMLTDRELQVFRLIGAGLGTKKISEELHLSVKTVEAHKEHIKKKIAAPSAAVLSQRAQQWLETGRI